MHYTYDLIYVYLWPLVVLWMVVKFTSTKAYRSLKSSRYAQEVIVPQSTPPQSSVVLGNGNTSQKINGEAEKPNHWVRFVRPFGQFFLLWALLLLNTSSVALTWVSLGVILFGTAAVVRTLAAFLADADSWISKLKSNFAEQVATNIRIIREYQSAQEDTASRNAANALLLYEAMFRYISENKGRLARQTLIASVLITIPMYLYVSFMFTTLYLGLARLAHIPWAWTDALTTSIFIPFAYTDLPHNLWIRLIGGCQVMIITVLGYTILFRRMQNSMRRISQAAVELASPLSDETVRAKLQSIKARSSPSVTAPQK